MNRTPIRGLAAALAAAVAGGGTFVGVNAWAEPSSSPDSSSVAPTHAVVGGTPENWTKTKLAAQRHGAAVAEEAQRQREIARKKARKEALARKRAAEAREQARLAELQRLREERARERAEQRRASRSEDRTTISSGDPRAIARSMVADRGWSAGEFSCLDSLWERESGWQVDASNSSSGAYGIPQALPGSKMAANGSDWETNPATQIDWGLDYITGSYGTPCGAWSTFQSQGWY